MFWGRVLSQDRFGLSNFELNVGVSENSGTFFGVLIIWILLFRVLY